MALLKKTPNPTLLVSEEARFLQKLIEDFGFNKVKNPIARSVFLSSQDLLRAVDSSPQLQQKVRDILGYIQARWSVNEHSKL